MGFLDFFFFIFLFLFFSFLLFFFFILSPFSFSSFSLPHLPSPPFIKVRIPNVLGFRALVSKVTGVIFSVPSGLIIGKEGPMIHIGAVIGSLVCQV